MKALVINSYTPGATTAWADKVKPTPGPGEVLIKVKAAGLNPLDLMIARGEFKQLINFSLPATLGQELAGEVAALGEGVTSFKVGDKVFARAGTTTMGAFAEYATVKEEDAAAMPAGLSFAEAAALPLVLLTAIQAFTEKTNVTPGSKVFIQGGAGGLGSIAIQVAKHLGAEVATTVSDKDVALAQSLGADVVIDYRTQNYLQHLSGYDVVLDTLGGAETTRAMGVLKEGGTLVSVAGAPDTSFAGQLGKKALAPVMWWLSRKERAAAKKAGVNYQFLFMRPSGQQLRAFTPAIESGAIKPLIGHTFPFVELPQALELMAGKKTKPGKIVVEVAN